MLDNSSTVNRASLFCLPFGIWHHFLGFFLNKNAVNHLESKTSFIVKLFSSSSFFLKARARPEIVSSGWKPRSSVEAKFDNNDTDSNRARTFSSCGKRTFIQMAGWTFIQNWRVDVYPNSKISRVDVYPKKFSQFSHSGRLSKFENL